MTIKIKINITPMSMKNGVLGLPISCCRDWDASGSVEGIFDYAGRRSPVTFSPKHIDPAANRASAWQFTVNDSVQFSELKIDGVYTYVEEAVSGEKLICDLTRQEDRFLLKVTEVLKRPGSKATNKIIELMRQGIRERARIPSSAPLWNSPSEWIRFDRVHAYAQVQDCLYIWAGARSGADTVYLYVGIVGDTRTEGRSKRNLAQRLKEEQKKFQKEYGIEIRQFRYCSLNHAQGYSVPELLKTVEMSEITVMTSLFRCENARDNIDALFADQDVILLNKMTSYKYVK